MRYDDSYEASAECLRLALGRMAQHQIAVNPLNYALWYEYVSNRNADLRELLDKLVNEGQVPDEDDARELFNNYILDGDEGRLEQVQQHLRKLLEGILASTVAMDERAAEYGASLQSLAPQLQENMGVEAIRDVVGALMAGTESMRQANEEMRQELASNASTVDELRRELESARQQAVTDPLTGLLNRKGFEEAVERVFAASLSGEESSDICLLMIDIDHFKRVNDTFGHLFGDKVIQGVGGLLRQSIKGQDSAARYGGEEFAVLLPSTSLIGAKKLGNAIRQRLARSRIRRGHGKNASQESVTVSLGAAQHREGESLGAWIERADKALYQAKQQGRNCLVGEDELPRI